MATCSLYIPLLASILSITKSQWGSGTTTYSPDAFSNLELRCGEFSQLSTNQNFYEHNNQLLRVEGYVQLLCSFEGKCPDFQ